MRPSNEILALLDNWLQNDALIRAAILTGSRASPNVRPDFLSDYDIALYVADIKPFLESDEWLNIFGPVIIRWPLEPASTFDEKWITRLVLFDDGVRLDFQITQEKTIDSNTYDNGYRILIDKDGLTEKLKVPGFTEFNIRRPSKTEFETLVNDFWWDATYVPKYLFRDELTFAKYMLDDVLRYSYLHRLIEWSVGCEHNWTVNTGCHGKWFKRYLKGEIWLEYESTFTGSAIEDNWEAYFRLIDLFKKLGKEVASGLGYLYPVDLDRRVMDYILTIRRNVQRSDVNNASNFEC